MGATAFGYELAKQFGLQEYGHTCWPCSLHTSSTRQRRFEPLSGIGLDCEIQCQTQSLRKTYY